jgi:hypothetical protein
MPVVIMTFDPQPLADYEIFYYFQRGKIRIILYVQLAGFNSDRNLLDAFKAFDIINQPGSAVKAFSVFPYG